VALTDHSHILVTTFGPDGVAESSVEWIVGLPDDRVGFWTPDVTGWQERLAVSPVVTIQACSSRGKVIRGEPLFEGRAELEFAGVVFDQLRKATHDKYGIRASLAGLVDKARELAGPDTPEGGVVFTIVG
jgi:hypothetical protein